MSKVLVEADALVNGDRQRDYGHPWDNYTDIAEGWSVLTDTVITPETAASMMIWLKLCREKHFPKHDNRVDAAGYVKVLDMIVEERKYRDEIARSTQKEDGFGSHTTV